MHRIFRDPDGVTWHPFATYLDSRLTISYDSAPNRMWTYRRVEDLKLPEGHRERVRYYAADCEEAMS